MSGNIDNKEHTTCTSCPLCGSTTKGILRLPFEYTKKKLEQICSAKFSSEIFYPDYELLACNNCTLEFASPFIAPSNQFYLWLTSQSFPYVTHRWEWDRAISLLREIKGNTTADIRLIDIGCGTGNFLKVIKKELALDAIGIDHNHDVIQQCVNNGLTAYCGDISHIEKIFPQGANIITLWHLLEHINTPIELLKNLRDRLSDNGLILASVPLSPMIAETLELDPLNLPPHHLTRWNSKSLSALSDKLEMQVEFYYPKSLSIMHMLLKTLIFASTHGKLNLSKNKKLYLLIKFSFLNINLVIKSFIRLKSQQKISPIHDIVLLKLTKNQ